MHARQPRAVVKLLALLAARVRVVMIVIVVMAPMIVVAMRVIVVAMRMILIVAVIAMGMVVAMAMRLAFGRLFPFDCRRPASANRAHYSTSSSLTRISSPPDICT